MLLICKNVILLGLFNIIRSILPTIDVKLQLDSVTMKKNYHFFAGEMWHDDIGFHCSQNSSNNHRTFHTLMAELPVRFCTIFTVTVNRTQVDYSQKCITLYEAACHVSIPPG